jgi:hypothetical protein
LDKREENFTNWASTTEGFGLEALFSERKPDLIFKDNAERPKKSLIDAKKWRKPVRGVGPLPDTDRPMAVFLGITGVEFRNWLLIADVGFIAFPYQGRTGFIGARHSRVGKVAEAEVI